VETNVDEEDKIVRSIGDYVVERSSKVKIFEPPKRASGKELNHKFD